MMGFWDMFKSKKEKIHERKVDFYSTPGTDKIEYKEERKKKKRGWF